jgi:hypothetical protein
VGGCDFQWIGFSVVSQSKDITVSQELWTGFSRYWMVFSGKLDRLN